MHMTEEPKLYHVVCIACEATYGTTVMAIRRYEEARAEYEQSLIPTPPAPHKPTTSQTKVPRDVVCPGCHEAFIATNPLAMYCSRRCHMRCYRARHKNK